MTKGILQRNAVLLLLVFVSLSLQAQTKSTKRAVPEQIDLAKFDEVGCRAKGRLQDREYCRSKMMDDIVSRGKAAVPLLILQLMDRRAINPPLFDFWNTMTVGDAAHAVLSDLFLDSDWKTFNLPGLDVFKEASGCSEGAWQCWNEFVKKHGRKFVQQKWSAAWNANRDHMYWDSKARCFRMMK